MSTANLGVIARKDTIRTAANWITFFRNGGKTTPHIILRPLTGATALKKTGEGKTLRSDGNIVPYRLCITDFDNILREAQVWFWSAARIPVVCLIDRGGKSIHAWFDVQKRATVETSAQWETEIKQNLYDRTIDGPAGS